MVAADSRFADDWLFHVPDGGVHRRGRSDGCVPKGDPPGFVQVVDNRTIAIPEREGNRRADIFTNVLPIPSVGLSFSKRVK